MTSVSCWAIGSTNHAAATSESPTSVSDVTFKNLAFARASRPCLLRNRWEPRLARFSSVRLGFYRHFFRRANRGYHRVLQPPRSGCGRTLQLRTSLARKFLQQAQKRDWQFAAIRKETNAAGRMDHGRQTGSGLPTERFVLWAMTLGWQTAQQQVSGAIRLRDNAYLCH